MIGAAYIFIAPNYKNEIANNNANKTNSIGSSASSLRMTKDIKAYTEESSAIVIGEFTRKGESEWSKDHVWIYTPYYFKVNEVLKVNVTTGSEIKIVLRGGNLDGQVQVNEEEMKFTAGDTNLL